MTSQMYSLYASPITALIVWLFLCLFIFRGIFYGKFKHVAWAKKKRMAAIALIAITTTLAPFCFWGYYSVVAVEDGGLYEEGSASFTLGPGDTYRSERLSNRYAFDILVVVLWIYSNPVTAYLCDENTPTAQYLAENYTGPAEAMYYLPHLFSGLLSIAKWTLHFYNPSPNATAGVSFEITGFSLVVDPPPPDLGDALLRFQAPFVGLFLLWIAAGIVTAIARRDMRRSLRQETQRAENAKPTLREDEME